MFILLFISSFITQLVLWPDVHILCCCLCNYLTHTWCKYFLAYIQLSIPYFVVYGAMNGLNYIYLWYYDSLVWIENIFNKWFDQKKNVLKGVRVRYVFINLIGVKISQCDFNTLCQGLVQTPGYIYLHLCHLKGNLIWLGMLFLFY